MKPRVFTYTTTGAMPWIPLDRRKKIFDVQVEIKINGTATIGVLEFTTEDVQNAAVSPYLAAATVNPTATIPLVNGTAGTGFTKKFADVTNPCTAIRLNVTSADASNTVVLTYFQSGV
jgi:hypothetical protein